MKVFCKILAIARALFLVAALFLGIVAISTLDSESLVFPLACLVLCALCLAISYALSELLWHIIYTNDDTDME